MALSYAVFGGCLRSELELPELPAVSGRPADWTLSIPSESIMPHPVEYLGEDHVTGAARVRLFRHEAGYRLEFDDTGSFDVAADGKRIQWYPGPAASLTAARIDVVGRVLALATHASGTLSLHGSAVAFGSGGVAFLAPKFHGKSTLATALARAGARVMTDDTIPVDPGPPALLRPGVQNLRLWRDSADRLADGLTPVNGSSGSKVVLTQQAARVSQRRVPLKAVYLLQPTASDSSAAVSRTPVPPVAAALAVMHHARLGPLLGRSGSGALLAAAAAVTRGMPVYALQVARNFERLPDVVAQIMTWHAPRAVSRTALSAEERR